MKVNSTLRSEALRRGVLTRYDFCGELVYGTDRADAIYYLMKRVFARAFRLLQIEFGSKARFQPRPPRWHRLDTPDFYWRKANFGIEITGPLSHSQFDESLHNVRSMRGERGAITGNPEIVRVSYRVVLDTPQKFLESIRTRLVASGAYPRLS